MTFHIGHTLISMVSGKLSFLAAKSSLQRTSREGCRHPRRRRPRRRPRRRRRHFQKVALTCQVGRTKTGMFATLMIMATIAQLMDRRAVVGAQKSGATWRIGMTARAELQWKLVAFAVVVHMTLQARSLFESVLALAYFCLAGNLEFSDSRVHFFCAHFGKLCRIF